MRLCGGCGELLPDTAFYRNGTRYCKPNGCHLRKNKQVEMVRTRRRRQLPVEEQQRIRDRETERRREAQRRYRTALNTLRNTYPNIFTELRNRYLEEGKDYTTARNHALVKLKQAFPEKYEEIRDSLRKED